MLQEENDVIPLENNGEELFPIPNPTSPSCIIVQGEDAGGIGLPHYGYTRPSTDYYNSNLILHNLVVSDVMTGINNSTVFPLRIIALGKTNPKE